MQMGKPVNPQQRWFGFRFDQPSQHGLVVEWRHGIDGATAAGGEAGLAGSSFDRPSQANTNRPTQPDTKIGRIPRWLRRRVSLAVMAGRRCYHHPLFGPGAHSQPPGW